MAYFDHKDKIEKVRKLYLQRLLKPNITSERARLITEAYQETISEPQIIRRAKGLAYILKNMTIYIKPWELLAGNLAPEPVSAPIFPEGGVDFILEELETYETRVGDRFSVSSEVKKELRTILPWWQGKTLKDYALKILPYKVQDMKDLSVFTAENMLTCGTGHFLPHYQKILRWGFKSIMDFSQRQLNEIEMLQKEDYDKYLFYNACLIICQSIQEFANRYVVLARELAWKEERSDRKRELLNIAEACQQVPMYPARNFREAIQTVWFTHVICYIDSNGYGVTLGRIIRDLYSYYRDSLKKKEVTKHDVLNYLISFWFKCNDILKLYNNKAAKIYGGFPVGQPIQLGGFNLFGDDETNELAELVLEAEKCVRLYQPDIAILWNDKMKDEFLIKATELIPFSHKPKFFNYHIGEDIFIQAKIAMEEARTNWSFIGCVEFGVPGKSWTWADAAMFNLAKCLELALNNGIDPVSGKNIGISTSSMNDFDSFTTFLAFFKKQVAAMFRLTTQGIVSLQYAHQKIWPEPYESLLVNSCLERGKEVNQGGADYYHTGVQFVGLATVADSLMAIKKWVFEEQEISLDELRDILKENFKGKEYLQKIFWYQTPKFGNDNQEVDDLTSDIFSFCCSELKKYRDIWGGIFTASFYTLTAHVGFGQSVGATPDGRFARTPLSDATSPVQGAIRNGPTAILKSQSKLPHREAINGTLLNIKFNKSLFNSRENVTKLAQLIKTYFQMGGFHVQFNVVDIETLKDAQKNPEKYPDFLIRVAAYVTNWNQLSKEVQDEIIERSEMENF